MSVLRVILLLVGCGILQSNSNLAQAQENVADYTRRGYLVRDEVRDYRPVNRFAVLQKAAQPTVFRKGESDVLRRRLLSQLKVDIQCAQCSVSIDEALDTPHGRFVVFRLIERTKGPTSLPRNGPPTMQNKASHIGIAVLNGRKLLLAPLTVRGLDEELAGEDQKLWDMFEFHGVMYILVFSRRYESDNFVLYQLDSDGLSKKANFEFGGL